MYLGAVGSTVCRFFFFCWVMWNFFFTPRSMCALGDRRGGLFQGYTPGTLLVRVWRRGNLRQNKPVVSLYSSLFESLSLLHSKNSLAAPARFWCCWFFFFLGHGWDQWGFSRFSLVKSDAEKTRPRYNRESLFIMLKRKEKRTLQNTNPDNLPPNCLV